MSWVSGKRRLGGGLLAAALLFSLGGCAIVPFQADTGVAIEPASERDTLADAAAAVKIAPWPKPQSVSLISRITGSGDNDRITRSEAISAYVENLQPAGACFSQLAADARANLSAADRLNSRAQNTLAGPRLSTNDVALIEGAIQTLREHRQIYIAAAKGLEKKGERIDEAQMDVIREDYRRAIKTLGVTADALADKIEEDRTETFAAPERASRFNLSGA